MPILLYSLIATGGALIGGLLNNNSEPSPIITPQESDLNVSSLGKAALYAASAVFIFMAAKKYMK